MKINRSEIITLVDSMVEDEFGYIMKLDETGASFQLTSKRIHDMYEKREKILKTMLEVYDSGLKEEMKNQAVKDFLKNGGVK